MTPADAIRAIRTALDLTQAQLARRIGTTQVSVSRWESGSRKPPAASVARLCALADDDGEALLAALRDDSAPAQPEPSGGGCGAGPCPDAPTARGRRGEG